MRLLLPLVCLIVFLFSCFTDHKKTNESKSAGAIKSDSFPAKNNEILVPDITKFTTLKIAGHEVDIAPPDSGTAYRGNIVILQGWNYPKHDWCQKAPELCKKAKAMGYFLIMPEMGRSVYATEFYKETREDFRKYPLRGWLVDSVFSYLQKNHNLLLKEQSNYLIGLSTGGRGVAMVALDRPDLFKAAAALSGDFDQSKIKNDVLTTLFYGKYENNPERWNKTDNIVHRIKEWKTPIYLGHGQLDKICTPLQTRQFYDSLVVHFDKNKVKINEPKTMAHDYIYWSSETDAMLKFFEDYK
jgi:enterochelin esterase-like enzyme